MVRETETRSNENRNWIVLTKGESSTVVFVRDCDCLVASISTQYSPNAPHVSYVYAGRNSADAHHMYLELIGELCLADSSSKFFGTPIPEEHCINGFSGDKSQTFWESLAEVAVQCAEGVMDNG